MSKLDREVSRPRRLVPGRPRIPSPRTRRHHGRWRRSDILRKKEEVTAMTCPFLKEAQVKYCQTSSVRKLILIAAAGRADEKCSSPEHLTSSDLTARNRWHQRLPATARTWRESLMQYCRRRARRQDDPSTARVQLCAAAATASATANSTSPWPTRNVPASDATAFRCPNGFATPPTTCGSISGETAILSRRYRRPFWSRALGQAERISYVWQRGATPRHGRGHGQRRGSRSRVPNPFC